MPRYSQISVRLLAIAFVFLTCVARAAEVIPPAPKNHFNDYANVVSQSTKAELNNRLVELERESSSQVVVAVYPKMQSNSSIEDYTQRVAQSWGVGTREKNNGAALFVFIQDRAMFLQVGYGLEGVIPDAIAKRIIDNEITPHFKNGNFDAGLRAGVTAIIQASKGEYKGTGRTIADSRRNSSQRMPPAIAIVLFVIFIFVLFRMMSSHATYYGPRGRRRRGGWHVGGFGGGGGWSSGGGGFGGGGSFSGGGGSFGGGGAGGRW
ncbi:MAG: TPM domain-containing protein [Limisphaerales bacterium]